jgi:hypothetical protein
MAMCWELRVIHTKQAAVLGDICVLPKQPASAAIRDNILDNSAYVSKAMLGVPDTFQAYIILMSNTS